MSPLWLWPTFMAGYCVAMWIANRQLSTGVNGWLSPERGRAALVTEPESEK